MFVSILFAKKKTLWVLSIQPASPDLLVLPSLPIAGTHLASEQLWQRILSLPIRNQYGVQVTIFYKLLDFCNYNLSY